jgi:hypothetical protein
MTLDGESWVEYFDSLGVGEPRLKATVTLARVSLTPARAERAQPGGLLDGIRYDPGADEIEVEIQHATGQGGGLRYFVPSPRYVTVEEHEQAKMICVTDAGGLRTMINLVVVDAELGRAEPRGAGPD